MKRTIIAALAVLMAGAFFANDAAAKDKKKAKKAEPAVQVALATSSDTLSYAAGARSANGLMDFIKHQYEVKDEFVPAFLEGLKEGLAVKSDQEKARLAGYTIAMQVIGPMVADMVKEFEGTPDSINADVFCAGFFAAAAKDTTLFTVEKAQEVYAEKHQADVAYREKRQKEEGMAKEKAFLDANKLKDGVKTTASGLQYKVLTEGTGAVPQRTDKVKVHYEGRLLDGKVFDSSYKRGEPATFTPTQVIKGWTEALTMMPVGSKWEVYIPYELAYGTRGAGKDIPPYSTLVFTIELIEIQK